MEIEEANKISKVGESKNNVKNSKIKALLPAVLTMVAVITIILILVFARFALNPKKEAHKEKNEKVIIEENMPKEEKFKKLLEAFENTIDAKSKLVNIKSEKYLREISWDDYFGDSERYNSFIKNSEIKLILDNKTGDIYENYELKIKTLDEDVFDIFGKIKNDELIIGERKQINKAFKIDNDNFKSSMEEYKYDKTLLISLFKAFKSIIENNENIQKALMNILEIKNTEDEINSIEVKINYKLTAKELEENKKIILYELLKDENLDKIIKVLKKYLEYFDNKYDLYNDEKNFEEDYNEIKEDIINSTKEFLDDTKDERRLKEIETKLTQYKKENLKVKIKDNKVAKINSVTHLYLELSGYGIGFPFSFSIDEMEDYAIKEYELNFEYDESKIKKELFTLTENEISKTDNIEDIEEEIKTLSKKLFRLKSSKNLDLDNYFWEDLLNSLYTAFKQ